MLIVYKLLFLISLFAGSFISQAVIYILDSVKVSMLTGISGLLQTGLMLLFFYKIYQLSKNDTNQAKFISHSMGDTEFKCWLGYLGATALMGLFSDFLMFGSANSIISNGLSMIIYLLLITFTIRVLFLGSKLIRK